MVKSSLTESETCGSIGSETETNEQKERKMFKKDIETFLNEEERDAIFDAVNERIDEMSEDEIVDAWKEIAEETGLEEEEVRDVLEQMF